MSEKQKRTYAKRPGGHYEPVFAGKVAPDASVDDVISALDLNWTNENPDEPTCRRDSFMKDVSLKAQAADVGYRLRLVRENRRIKREVMCELLNVSSASYARYETGVQAMNISTLIQLCEILQVMPIELLGRTSPHLWGKTQEECELNFKLTNSISRMSIETRHMLLGFMDGLKDEAASLLEDANKIAEIAPTELAATA